MSSFSQQSGILQTKVFNKIQIAGQKKKKKKDQHENLWIAKVLEESVFHGQCHCYIILFL